MSLDNLPVEWLKSSFAHLNDYRANNFNPLKNDETYYELYSVPIFPEGYPEILQAKEIGSSKQIVEKNDILLCKINPRINRVWQVSKHTDYLNIASSEWIVFRQGNVVPKFYRYYFQSLEFRNLLCANVSGVGGSLTRAQPKHVATYDLPVPPLAEQQEIVRQLDLMLAQVEQIKARLDAIPAILKKFRQSVLADAVSGKLTEEWREVAEFDVDTWTYERAEDLCLKVQSGSTPRNNPFDQNGTIPFLKVYNIVDQKIAFDYKPQFILQEVHDNGSKRSICKAYDVLMNIVGPPLGKVAIVTDQYPEWNINQAITMFRVHPEKLNYKFLYYVLCEGQIVRDVLHDTKGSVGQINISLSQCRDALIPKPSLIEQDAIVETIDSLLGMADKIENTVQSAQKRVNLLTQSILAKAFSGELTAEWRQQHQELITGVNSAESLLAKIQAEREASKPVKKAKKVK